MKKFFAAIVLLSTQTAFSETIHLHFKSMTQAKGTIHWAMYVPGSEWPGEGSSTFGGSVPVTTLEVAVQVPNVPLGTYAIASYQDINNNGKMDKRLGYPLEPFGFSNNVRPTVLGAPSFEKAKFDFISDSQVVEIEIKPF